MSPGPWVIDVFRTEQGEALVQAFIAALMGRDRDEAFALVKLLEEQGNARQEGEKMMSAKKTAFMQWIDGQLKADKDFARRVDEIVNEMKIEQELVALREKRGISQRAAARLIGASQPYVAKLESGRIKNLGVKTLVKYATALGGKVTLKIDSSSSGSKSMHRALRRAS